MPRLIDHNERRLQLAEATWRVIARDGIAGASVRAVAAEAGRSPGSLRHLFSSQSDLLVFALDLVVERVTARIDALPAQPTATATVEAVAAQLLPLDSERRTEMEVYLALFTAAHTHRELRAPRDTAHQTVRQACTWMVGELARTQALPRTTDLTLEAKRLHALIDGLAAHLLYEPHDHDPQWAADILRHHIHGLTTAPH